MYIKIAAEIQKIGVNESQIILWKVLENIENQN